jgi:fucose 4-O-acetylase-like acetyltransferase
MGILGSLFVMFRMTVVIGFVLVAMGFIGYLVTGATSPTALIPSLVGLLLFGCAAVAPTRDALGMHLALAVALLGALGTLPNVAKIGQLLDGAAERPAAVVVSTLMFLVLVGYLVAGIRSFVVARRAGARPA